jgi:hypothetical protein
MAGVGDLAERDRSTVIYLIGSLRNPAVPGIAQQLRDAGFDVFDDWYAAGPHADDCWRDYEQARGHSYRQALQGFAARHVFSFDRTHLDRSSTGVLVCPAGKSGHLELGFLLGQGKPGYILLDGEPERFDVMYQFATGVCTSVSELAEQLILSSVSEKVAAVVTENVSTLYPA